jgi:hypothetical protein
MASPYAVSLFNFRNIKTLRPDRAAVVGSDAPSTRWAGMWGSLCAFERSFVIRSDRIVIGTLRALTVDVETCVEKYISAESEQNCTLRQ